MTSEKERKQDHRSTIRENKKFYEYYKCQNLLDEKELDEMFKIMQELLPISFRLTKNHLEWTKSKIDLKPLPFLAHGYQTPYGKKEFRQSDIYDFVSAETNIGGIWRAETVSMIPPVILDVKENDAVLDMCSAPGSKTSQLAEALNGTGILIANDANKKRASMLIHQLKVVCPSNILFTCHNGQKFPFPYFRNASSEVEPLYFDKILCDVPCSGDGTTRKNVNVWNRWSPNDAIGLHPMQLAIAIRAIHMLKVGGKMVYSTCSMNPVENEAVVYNLLKHFGGKIKLVKCRNILGKFKTREGIKSWTIPKHYITESNASKVKAMLPGSDISNFNIEDCVRIYPHDNNTGGFFVCLFEKLEEIDYGPKTKPIDEYRAKYKLPELNSGLFREYIQRADNFQAFFLQPNSQADTRMREMFPFTKYANHRFTAVSSGGRNRGFFYFSEFCYNVAVHSVSLFIVNSGCKLISGLRGSVVVDKTEDLELREAPRFHDESLPDILRMLNEYKETFVIPIDYNSLVNLIKGLNHFKNLRPEFVAVVANLPFSAFILEYKNENGQSMYFSAFKSKVSIVLLQDKEDLKSTALRMKLT
eukprot:NODE_71_length_24927_cov_1.205937.p2 type:complete len:587 gc:universal NODE_71_length_24927_cov_1.205937:20942-19182(-)